MSQTPASERVIEKDVIIVGGSLGGVSAAMASARGGRSVAVLNEFSTEGGQITTQAVPLDVHAEGERLATRTLKGLLDGIRRHYKDNYLLTPEAQAKEDFSPGNGWVSKLCSDPRVNLTVLREMMAPYKDRLTIFNKHKVVAVERVGDTIKSVTGENTETKERITFQGKMFLDATDDGVMLLKANISYRTGAESKEQTGEPSAPEKPDPNDMQGFTMVLIIEYDEAEDANHTIEKPEQYDFWKAYVPQLDPPWPGKLLSWTTPLPWDLQTHVKNTLFLEEGAHPETSLFNFRKIRDKNNFRKGTPESKSDVTAMIWPQNDYFLGNIINVSEEERARHIENAKQLSLSLLYWLQTEAPRPDGGKGYPGLKLRKDIVGTEDGLGEAPYIRESRRITAAYTLVEQDISAEWRTEPKHFDDVVGELSYKIDLHPTTGGENYFDKEIAGASFEIPLGIFIPKDNIKNFLPAGKNAGTTHITNGPTRVHPGEWLIGEVSGHLAVYCLKNAYIPAEVYPKPELVKEFQQILVNEGVLREVHHSSQTEESPSESSVIVPASAQ